MRQQTVVPEGESATATAATSAAPRRCRICRRNSRRRCVTQAGIAGSGNVDLAVDEDGRSIQQTVRYIVVVAGATVRGLQQRGLRRVLKGRG